MALTEYYIDTTNGSDATGTGAIGAPWKTTQHALNSIVQGAQGDRLHYINSAADDVLSATLSLATYGTPAFGKPLVFYGDGIIGGISGNSGGFPILSSGSSGIVFANMHLHHTGASPIVSLNTSSFTAVVNCEFDHSTSGRAVSVANATDNYFHDCSGTNALLAMNTVFNRFDGLASTPTSAMVLQGGGSCIGNLIVLNGSNSCWGVSGSGSQTVVMFNAIFGNGSTGRGIGDNTFVYWQVANNIVEGFSGVGGQGYSIGATASVAAILSANNRAYNNTTNFNNPVVFAQFSDYVDAVSNFVNAATGDLSLATGSPARANSFPGTYKGSPTQTSYDDAGALQHADGGGGGSSASPNYGIRTGGRM